MKIITQIVLFCFLLNGTLIFSQNIGNNAEVKLIKGTPSIVSPGGRIQVTVRVKNIGRTAWSPVGKTHVQVSGNYYIEARVTDPCNTSNYLNDQLILLPKTIAPNESLDITGYIVAPDSPGRYSVILDMVDAYVQAFGAHPYSSLQEALEESDTFEFRVK